jgi:hypothetical protein
MVSRESFLSRIQASLGLGSRHLSELTCREWEFRRALTYQGTGSRIQAFLRKARSGKPFTVAVIGGSGESLPIA